MRAAVLLTALLTVGCGPDVRTANYATAAEAQPAVEQGLVPAGLPQSSYEIRAAYVPGSWQRWGIINFPPEGAGQLRALIDPEEISLTGVTCDIPPRIEWWPVQLRRALDDEKVKATGAKAYRARSGNMLVVVNWAQGRAYYWTTS